MYFFLPPWKAETKIRVRFFFFHFFFFGGVLFNFWRLYGWGAGDNAFTTVFFFNTFFWVLVLVPALPGKPEIRII